MSLIDLASLVLAPTATKEGKVYSAIPDTGDGDMTFTRGSAATRVNSEGLIEKERANLLLQSNTFSTSWGTNNASITGGQSGYDGSSDAWLLDSSSEGYLFQYPTSIDVGTVSIYAKANSVNNLRLRTFGASINAEGFFDLENGVVGSSTNLVHLSIEAISGGWYRCSVVFDNAPSLVRIYPSVSSSTSSGTIGSIYIQDAMLNQGLVAQSYIETTTTAVYEGITDDVPRVDYSGGGCPSLLLEGQRTNLIEQSEYLAGGSLSFATYDGITTDTLSPEGVFNANKFSVTTSGVDSYNRRTYSASVQDFSLSIYLKGAAGQKFELFLGRDSYAELKTKLHTCSGDWERVVLSESFSTTSSSVVVGLEFGHTSNDSVAGQEYYLYGLQLEAGSYVSSYTPTYGTSTTRVADSCSKTGISELIGQTEGTMLLDFVFNGNPTSVDYSIMILGAIGSNYISIGGYNKSLYARVFDSTLQGTINALQMVAGTRYKVAVAYAGNDVVMYVNGVNEGSDTSVSIPALSQVGFTRPSFEHSADVKQAILFPTRLTNDQLSELTK